MGNYLSERPKNKGYIRLSSVQKRLTSFNYGTIHSRWGFDTLLGGFRKGSDTKPDSAKNDRLLDDFTRN